jgi:DNA-binding transcriptional LysR family regulator
MKRLSLEQLDSWLAVVENGSFRSAARSLSRSQATVSQHVQRLEAYIGGKLIQRGQRNCGPTTLGKRLAPIARSLIHGEKQISELHSLCSPRLGACSNIGVYLLPQLLASFCARHPRPPLQIGTNFEIADALLAGLLDMALLESWEARPGLLAQPWRREAMIGIAPPGHPWAGRPRVTLADFRNETLIGGECGTGTGRLLRDAIADGASLPAPAMKLGSTEAVKRAVAAGLGVSIVLEMSSVVEMRERRLLVFPLEPRMYKSLWLVRRAELDTSDALFNYLASSVECDQRVAP